jgi:hypothetical protein
MFYKAKVATPHPGLNGMLKAELFSVLKGPAADATDTPQP